MKKIFGLLCAVVLTANVMAADWNNDITISWGPGSAPNIVLTYMPNDIIAAIDNLNGNFMLENMATLGHFSFNYHGQVKNWLALGAKLTFENNEFDLKSINKDPMVVATLGGDNVLLAHSQAIATTAMFSMRFTYLNKRVVKLYSGIDLGVGMAYWKRTQVWDGDIPLIARQQDETLQKLYEVREKYGNGSNFYCIPAWDITPIGITVGTRLYGLAELNIGTDALFKVGFGVRFL